MMRKENTKLEVFTFGDKPGDKFYCLVDCKISPDGLDIDKMKMTDPRNFDVILREMGCLAMLTELEVQELVKRGELETDDLHTELFELCKRKGIIES